MFQVKIKKFEVPRVKKEDKEYILVVNNLTADEMAQYIHIVSAFQPYDAESPAYDVLNRIQFCVLDDEGIWIDRSESGVHEVQEDGGTIYEKERQDIVRWLVGHLMRGEDITTPRVHPLAEHELPALGESMANKIFESAAPEREKCEGLTELEQLKLESEILTSILTNCLNKGRADED